MLCARSKDFYSWEALGTQRPLLPFSAAVTHRLPNAEPPRQRGIASPGFKAFTNGDDPPPSTQLSDFGKM